MIGVLAGCGKAPPSAPAPAPASAVNPHEALNRLIERFFDEGHAADEEITPQRLADDLAVERHYLAGLNAIPRETLTPQERLSYDIFKRQRELAAEGFTYPQELLPLNPFRGVSQRLAAVAAQLAQHPLSAEEFKSLTAQLSGADGWMRQALTNLKDGLRRGYLEPRALVEYELPLLEKLGETGQQGELSDIGRAAFADSVNPAQRAAMQKELRQLIDEALVPDIRALHDYLARVYLPKARASLGLKDLPLGDAWYAYRVRRVVGPGVGAADIHRLALTEAERLKGRVVSPEASMPALPVAELLAGYEQLLAKVSGNLVPLFGEQELPPLQIRATDLARAPAAPLSYEPDSGLASALLFVDGAAARHLDAAGFLAEAVPGAHLQWSWQRRASLPRFRRFGSDPAYRAGWGLYAATLGEELQAYGDESQRQQLVHLQLRCAAFAVIDTALNDKGWTTPQALDYLHNQLNFDDGAAEALMLGAAAMPGDGLACLMGGLKFQSLKARAQQALGARFDLREFHAQILRDGAMPLDILDAKLKAWVESPR
jgi:uncharacterized protein (DUF885 family)